VITTVENHRFFCQNSARVEALVSEVDHPNFGVLIDLGNFLCIDEEPAAAVGVLTRHAVHVHAKDFHVKSRRELPPGEGWFASRSGAHLRGAILGHGVVLVLACLRILKAAGYDGSIVVEFEGLEDPMQALRLGLANLRRMLALLE
jgi:sugar phosphate isomerase/epimerase